MRKYCRFFDLVLWTNNTLPNNNTYAQSVEQKSAPDTLPSLLLHCMLSDIYKRQYFRQYFRYRKPRTLRTSTNQPYNPNPRVEAKLVAREPLRTSTNLNLQSSDRVRSSQINDFEVVGISVQLCNTDKPSYHLF